MKRFSRVGLASAIVAVVAIAAAGGPRSQAALPAIPAAISTSFTRISAAGVTVSSGEYFSCVLTGGRAQCWGFNTWGQLGNGEVQESELMGTPSPVDVVGLGSPVVALDAGGVHACALTTGGGVVCWGGNGAGQLGDGTTTNRATPVDLVGLDSGVRSVSAGGDHTCAVTDAGGVKCWGYNAWGQLGDGTTADRSTPVDVVGLGSGVTAVSAGGTHTCALTEAGGVTCWGSNGGGRLGDGTLVDRPVPVPVPVVGLGSGVARVSAGHAHACALSAQGEVRCWGSNTVGQLGDGTTTDRATPTGVVGLEAGAVSLDAGGGHNCAVTAVGGLKCWGANTGQLGDDSEIARLEAVDVVGLAAGIEAVSAGYEHTCAVTLAGGLRCWGFNLHGEIGDGENTIEVGPGSSDLHFTSHLTPVPVLGFE